MVDFVPEPTNSNPVSLLAWARDLVTYLRRANTTPEYRQLPYLTGGEKAATNGTLAWDVVNQRVVVAKNGAWVAV